MAKRQPSKPNRPKRPTGKVNIPKFKVLAPPPGPVLLGSFTGSANGIEFILVVQADAQGNLVSSSVTWGPAATVIAVQGTFNQATQEINFAFAASTSTPLDVLNFHGYFLGSGVLAGIFEEILITIGPPFSMQDEKHGWWAFPNPQ